MMSEVKRDTHPTSTTGVSKNGSPSWFVISTLADTTWRVAVPTVLLSVVGIFADKAIGTMPLFTLIGLVLGLAAAGKLVWDQMKKAEKETKG